MSVARQRTGGMTAIAVLNLIVGGLETLHGLFQVLGSLVLMSELLRLGIFEIPIARVTFSLLILATGIVGLIAGVQVRRQCRRGEECRAFQVSF
jgi:hypothetical protein